MKKIFAGLLVLGSAVCGPAQAQTPVDLWSLLEGRYTPSTAPEITYRGPDGRHVSGRFCATPEPTAAERQRINAELDAFVRVFGEDEARRISIPVAFHVIYRDARSNVPDEMLEAQIDVLNDAFRTHGFSFHIASVDRTKKSSWFRNCGDIFEGGTTFFRMTDRLSIDPAHTLNIYLCGLSGGLLGFAFFPSFFPEDSTLHGVTALYSTLPGGSAFPYDEGDTIVHEVGHYLGLYHTFQDGCAGGDMVADTPAEALPAFGCEVGRDTCPAAGTDPVTNYMDYGDNACMVEFTRGQRQRMSREVRRFRPSLGS